MSESTYSPYDYTYDDTRRLGPPPPPPKRRTGRTVLVAAVVSALVSAGVTVPLVRALDDDESTGSRVTQTGGSASSAPPIRIDGTESPVAAVAKAVGPSVAQVEVSGFQGSGSGSAVIFRADGYLLTNNHVVENAQQLQVRLPDGSTRDAEIVGTDPSTDLAVIRIDADDLPVPAFAEGLPAVGDAAIAIGSPFGLEGSVTSGIVSALDRPVDAPQTPLSGMIQTDAAINPGNSGGALVNGDAEVIGINTAILSPSGANNGIGFAIPIQTALSTAEQLVEQGFVRHGQLGIQGQDVDPNVAELYGLEAEEGALVVEVVPGSAAEEAGLQRGDIITAVDGDPVDSMAALAGQIRQRTPGDDVTLTYVRGGDEQTTEATLDAAPTQGG